MTDKIKYLLLAISSLLSIGLILHLASRNLDSDSNFIKLTETKGKSLVIGTSRAARLKSEDFNAVFDSALHSVDNFSFNLSVSPYGEVYNHSIMRVAKKHPSDDSRVFILCIDPWALSDDRFSSLHSEEESFMTFNPDLSFPRLRYAINHISKPLIEQVFTNNDHRSQRIKHLSKTDSAFIAIHTESKIDYYRENHVAKKSLSQFRLDHLEQLIIELKELGNVFLIRLPISDEMIRLEQEYAPNFMDFLNSRDVIKNCPIIDFYPTAGQYACFDGNHLFEEDAHKISTEIASKVLAYIQENEQIKSHANAELISCDAGSIGQSAIQD